LWASGVDLLLGGIIGLGSLLGIEIAGGGTDNWGVVGGSG
jgi:hypothetical protein